MSMVMWWLLGWHKKKCSDVCLSRSSDWLQYRRKRGPTAIRLNGWLRSHMVCIALWIRFTYDAEDALYVRNKSIFHTAKNNRTFAILFKWAPAQVLSYLALILTNWAEGDQLGCAKGYPLTSLTWVDTFQLVGLVRDEANNQPDPSLYAESPLQQSYQRWDRCWGSPRSRSHPV